MCDAFYEEIKDPNSMSEQDPIHGEMKHEIKSVINSAPTITLSKSPLVKSIVIQHQAIHYAIRKFFRHFQILLSIA